MKEITPQVLRQLFSIIKDKKRFSTKKTDKISHSQDKSFHKPSLPDIVI